MSLKSAPVTALVQIVSGFGAAHAIYLAAELGLADSMRDGSKSSEELAQASGMHAPSLRRVLRALASAGLCTEDDQGRYSLTAVGETLRTDVPGTLRAWVRFVLGEECRIAWGGLINSVRTGEAAFDKIFGADVWTYRAQHPASARRFDDAMGNVSELTALEWEWFKQLARSRVENRMPPRDIRRKLVELKLMEERRGGGLGLPAQGAIC